MAWNFLAQIRIKAYGPNHCRQQHQLLLLAQNGGAGVGGEPDQADQVFIKSTGKNGVTGIRIVVKSMADVVSKSNLFRPPCIHRHWISIFPNNWNYNSGVSSSTLREFPSLKLKPMSLRSSSLGSDFCGARIVVE